MNYDLALLKIQHKNESILKPILNLLYDKLKDKILKFDFTLNEVHSTSWACVDYWKNKTDIDKEIDDIVEYFDEYNNILFLSESHEPYLFGVVKDDSEHVMVEWVNYVNFGVGEQNLFRFTYAGREG